MLEISLATTKHELLQNLIIEADRKGELAVFVKSLPTFLATEISFGIFLYQISNYPRPLVWYSEQNQIAQFLQECGVKSILKTSHNPTNNYNIQVSQNPQQVYGQGSINNPKTETPLKVHPSTVISLNKNSNQNNSTGSSNARHISLGKILEKNDYQPTFLLSTNSDEVSGPNPIRIYPSPNNLPPQPPASLARQAPQVPTRQPVVPHENLDMWLKKLELTKKSLNQKKMTNRSFAWPRLPSLPNLPKFQLPKPRFNFVKNITSQFNKFKPTNNWRKAQKIKDPNQSIKWNKINLKSGFGIGRIAQVGLASMAMTFLLLSFLLVSPTRVYTLEITLPENTKSLTLNLPYTILSQEVIDLSIENSAPPTGVQEQVLEKAVGQVELVNNAGKDLWLTNGGFKISRQNKKYFHITNSRLPDILIIPARSSLKVNVQAEQSGNGFNQNSGTEFKILNLLDQEVCGNCLAKTTTDIKNVSIKPEKVVTQTDIDNIVNKNKTLLKDKRNLELVKLVQEKQAFTNPNWYELVENKDTPDQIVGQAAPNVKVSSRTKQILKYITNEQIKEAVKKEVTDKGEIKNVQVISSQSELQDRQNIELKVDYSYLQNIEVNESELASKLSYQTFNQAEAEIKNKYPHVTKISRQDSGISIPGVPYRVDVAVIKNKIN